MFTIFFKSLDIIVGVEFTSFIFTNSITGIIMPFLFINFKDDSLSSNACLEKVDKFFVFLLNTKKSGTCSGEFPLFFTAISIPLKAR